MFDEMLRMKGTIRNNKSDDFCRVNENIKKEKEIK